jgi:hypothetical protein
MSNSSFLCTPQRIFEGGTFYARAAPKVGALQQLFPEDDLELFIAIRNPATFIPAAWRASGMDWDDFIGRLDPRDLRWSDVITAIRNVVPSARLCVWCNEDTTLIWGSLLRQLAGIGSEQAVLGEYDLLASVMSPEGMQRFVTYMEAHPGQTELQVRRVIGAFLDKFAIPEEVEEEVDAPGWDAHFVDRITRAYDEDINRIAQMPGVDFIAP